MKIFIRLIALVKPFFIAFLAAIGMGLLTSFSGIGLLSASAYLISKAALQPSIAALQIAIVGVRFLGLSRGVFRYLERIFSHQATFKILASLRVWFFQAIEPLIPSKLQDFQSADLFQRVIEDVDSLQNFFVRVLYPPIVAFFTMIAMFIFLNFFDPGLGFASLLSPLFLGMIIPIPFYFVEQGLKQETQKVRKNLYIRFVESIQGLGDLMVLNGANRQMELISSAENTYSEYQHQQNKLAAARTFLLQFINFGIIWLILVLSISIFRSAQIDFVFLAVVVLGVQASHEAYINLSVSYEHWENMKVSANRLFELIDQPQTSTSGSASMPKKEFEHIRIKDLSFQYEDRSRNVLNTISLEIRKGKVTALVGESGAGKSTIVNLLLRFWKYQKGSVYLDDLNIKEIDEYAMRKIFSVIPQTPHLFNTTIRENLLIARPDANDQEIYEALDKAGLRTFVDHLVGGINAQLGEQGLKLSGGERQRLSIARAILSDSQFLLCDEPTAELDPINGKKILSTIQNLKKSKGILIITHQLEYLEKVERIYVLLNGEIVEQGSYNQLLGDSESLFYKMHLERAQYFN